MAGPISVLARVGDARYDRERVAVQAAVDNARHRGPGAPGAGVPRNVEQTEAMQHLADAVQQGRSPADAFADQVIENGIAATVTQLALGEL